MSVGDAYPQEALLLHIWWDCPPVWQFWQKIFELYCKLIATSLQPSPEVARLSIILGPQKSVKKDVLRHFIAAAWTVIPRHRKLTSIPSLGDWAIEVDRIRDLKRMLAQENDKEEQVSLTWISWSMFWYATEFVIWAGGDLDVTTP